MTEKHGVKELTEIVIFFCRLGNGIDSALADGSIGIFDARHMYGPLKAAGPAIKDATKAFKELQDLDSLERDQLVLTVSQELDLSVDAVEEIIEDVVKSALDFYMNYKKVSLLIKDKKK